MIENIYPYHFKNFESVGLSAGTVDVENCITRNCTAEMGLLEDAFSVAEILEIVSYLYHIKPYDSD